jgi:hypothetical protein
MSRPRIRTLKPESWQDEKIGRLSRDARLLRVVLITYSDDDGRFRAMPSAICGFGYMYDSDAPRKLAGWLKELVKLDLICLYEHEGLPYGVIPKFRQHQRISHPRDSILPSPNGALAHEEVRT